MSMPRAEPAAGDPPGLAENRIQRVWLFGTLGADGRPFLCRTRRCRTAFPAARQERDPALHARWRLPYGQLRPKAETDGTERQAGEAGQLRSRTHAQVAGDAMEVPHLRQD